MLDYLKHYDRRRIKIEGVEFAPGASVVGVIVRTLRYTQTGRIWDLQIFYLHNFLNKKEIKIPVINNIEQYAIAPGGKKIAYTIQNGEIENGLLKKEKHDLYIYDVETQKRILKAEGLIISNAITFNDDGSSISFDIKKGKKRIHKTINTAD